MKKSILFIITKKKIFTICLFLGIALNVSAQNDFIATWKTDNTGTSNNTSVTIPTTGVGYSYQVDWGDGAGFGATTYTGNTTHDYGVGNAGTYTIKVQGTFPRIFFNNAGDNLKIVSVEQWGANGWTSMDSAFYGCANLVNNATDTPNLSGVTSLNLMFASCTNLGTGTATNWDAWNVSNVTNMEAMFKQASSFNKNINSWNTSNVTSMYAMFFGATTFNQSLRSTGVSWNTSNVTYINSMFYNAVAFNGDITNWDTSKVIFMSSMFYQASTFNQALSSWNTSSVTDMSFMFSYANSFNQDLSNWNVGVVTDMSSMFTGVTLSLSNYDALLTSFANQTTQNSVIFNGGNSKYCASASDRNTLTTAPKNWTITDGGIQATTWTGAVDSDWANAANWTGCLPTLYHDVVISNSVTNTPSVNASTNALAKNLTINSGAHLKVLDKGGLTVNNNLINNGFLNVYALSGSGSILCNGNYTGNNVSYYVVITRNKWFLMNSPVTGQDIYGFINSFNGVITSASNNYSIASYNNSATGASNSWAYYNTTNLTSSGTNFGTGTGYAMERDNSGSLYSSFSGKILNGDAAIPITVGSYNAWNLIGNPYPSFLSLSDFLSTNSALLKPTHQAIYIWDNTANAGSGGYVPHTGNQFISVAQAFFVNAQSSGNISIKKSMQSHQTSNSSFKTTTSDIFKINLVLKVESQQRKTEIYFDDNLTVGLDPGKDLGVFGGVANNLAISSKLLQGYNEVNFMIQALPKSIASDVEIPINVTAIAGSELKFTANLSNLPKELNVYLEDRLLNIFVKLNSSSSEYTVLLKDDENSSGRFYLRTSTQVLSTENILQNSEIYIFQNKEKNTLTIRGLKNEKYLFKMYTVLGEKISEKEIKGSKSSIEIPLIMLARGVYIVSVSTEGSSINRKIVIQ